MLWPVTTKLTKWGNLGKSLKVDVGTRLLPEITSDKQQKFGEGTNRSFARRGCSQTTAEHPSEEKRDVYEKNHWKELGKGGKRMAGLCCVDITGSLSSQEGRPTTNWEQQGKKGGTKNDGKTE